MATFLEVCRAVAPEARSVEPTAESAEIAAAGTRAVGWVRVLKPRVPAFDALDPGDLAIVPAHALAYVAPGPSERDALADALAAAGVAGVLLLETDEESKAGPGGTSAAPAAPAAPNTPATPAAPAAPAAELGAAPAPAAPELGVPATHLGLALAARGVPALIGRGDAATLERSAIAYLVNRRAGLERLAGDLERRVERLVLAGRGPDDIAAAIGAFVARPVVIERRRGEPLAIHASVASNEAGAAAVTSAVARYHARPSDVPFRLPLPGPDGRPVGALVILGGEPVGERERVAAERVSTVVALALGRIPGLVAPPVGREGLPAAGPPWIVVLGRQERPLGADGSITDSREAREAIRNEIVLIGGPDTIVLRGDAASIELRAVVAADPADRAGRALVERISGVLGRTVAVSRRFDDPAARPAAEADARMTLEAVERLAEPDRPRVALTERLPAYRILGELAYLPDGLREARALLAPLLTGSPTAQRDRVATLRAVLEHDGAGDVATALGVHRNTVAYRVRSIERLGGWDLTDPDLRLALAISCRIVQTEQ
ncbi:MAG TPA: helix-turn-helix domain-containing protein [Candidatus Limnocylindrales bacterium]